jgi:hypothetical protein
MPKIQMTMTRKTRRAFLGTAALTGAMGITGAVSAQENAETISFEETFDDSDRTWKADADAPTDMEIGSDWNVEVADNRAFSGDKSLQLSVDATQGFATVWGVTEVDVERGQSYDVEVTTQFWNEMKSFNSLSNYRAYFGPNRPETITDFPSGLDSFPLYDQEASMAVDAWSHEGWTEYPLYWQTPELETDTLYLALAVQPTWETTVEHAVDNVSVQMDPR